MTTLYRTTVGETGIAQGRLLLRPEGLQSRGYKALKRLHAAGGARDQSAMLRATMTRMATANLLSGRTAKCRAHVWSQWELNCNIQTDREDSVKPATPRRSRKDLTSDMKELDMAHKSLAGKEARGLATKLTTLGAQSSR